MIASVLNGLAGSICYMTNLSDRIREAMGKMTKAELARAAEVSAATVTFWLDGSTKSINGEKAVLLERATGYRATWLISGKGPKRVEATQQSDPSPVYAGRRSGTRAIPIVGTARLGERGFYEEISSIPGAGDGHIDIATTDPNAYGLRVRGSSMAPAIRDGWYVLVEPNSAPAVGEYVLVKLKDGQRMVKELLYRRPGIVEVLSVNGGERLTIYDEDLEALQAIAAVVAPSKWKPD
jgi:phage repressor protein C with HTH and peptisase S24 domain